MVKTAFITLEVKNWFINSKFQINKNTQTMIEPEIDIFNLIEEFNYKPSHKKDWLDKALKSLVK